MAKDKGGAMSQGVLPDQFADLEAFVADWSLAEERARNQKRLSSSMEELRTFYDAIFPRMEAILEYLRQFPLDTMPEEVRRLFFLTLSLAEIAPAVEFFGQPGVIDGFESTRFVPGHEPRFSSVAGRRKHHGTWQQ